MQQNEKASQDGTQTKCEGCKRGVEHYSAVLPFAVIEKPTDKPLRNSRCHYDCRHKPDPLEKIGHSFEPVK